MRPRQIDVILAHLRIKPIDPMEALKYLRCFRLAARIADLRALGHVIHTEVVTTQEGKHYARYHLLEEAK